MFNFEILKDCKCKECGKTDKVLEIECEINEPYVEYQVRYIELCKECLLKKFNK